MGQKRQRFVVIVRIDEYQQRAFGIYRSFMAASRDARAWNGYVMPVEDMESGSGLWGKD